MKIDKLTFGTKLMWDADPIGDWYNNGQRIVYPATVCDHHPRNDLVRIKTPGNTSWMGPESDKLRLPTEEELKTLKWPEPDYSKHVH